MVFTHNISKISVSEIGKILLLVTLLFISCQSKIQEQSPIKASENFDSIRDDIIQLVKEGKTPSFSVAVLQNEKIIWYENFEQSLNTSEVLISSDIKYPIASLTKSMSATVLLKLVEKGQISLNDPIEKYLPKKVNFYGRNSISVKELLNMTGGIPHGWIFINSDSPYAAVTNDSLIENYSMTVFPKGIYEYSNYSYGIVEAIIENISNKPYAQVLQDEMFDLLGMKHSFITPITENKLEHFNDIKEVGQSSLFFPSGGAGVYSTLSDLILFARLQMGELDESIMSHSSLNLLHYDKIYPSTITSLGWGSIPLEDDLTWLVSNGSFPNSANSNLTIIPENNIAVICLANKDYQSSADMLAIKIADVLVPGFANKAFAKMEAYEANDGKEVKISIGKFNTWQGVMKHGKTESLIELTYKSDSLYVSFDNGEWQSVKYATIDHQSIIRGGLTILLKNPLTNQVEESHGNINLLLSEKKLQGYFSASFIKEDVFDLALPFYIEALGRD
jgi:CubicO group peptidase (beta-lactamase class C family)